MTKAQREKVSARNQAEVAEHFRDDALMRGMAGWFRLGMADEIRSRTPEQQAWDSAVIACAEYLRRTGHGTTGRTLFNMLTPMRK